MKKWGISSTRKPKIAIVHNSEMPALGMYEAVSDTVFYTPDILDKRIMVNEGGLKSVEYHEMWHKKQAEDFRQAGWKITKENQAQYVRVLCKKCKKNIDRLGINKYNVSEISEYAERSFSFGRFDEVEAEWMTKHRKE